MGDNKKTGVYLGVAVPHVVASRRESTNCKETGTQIKALVERGSKGIYYPWQIPAGQLKVGTLDDLVGLSDDLGKHDQGLRNNLVQIKKIFLDYDGKEESLAVAQSSPGQYLQKFQWNTKYNVNRSLSQLVAEMNNESRTNLTNLIKIKAACVDCNRKIQAISKKTEGALTVRDFEHKLKKDTVIQTEMFDTLFVVVQKGRAEKFLESYQDIKESKEAQRLIEFLEEREKAEAEEEKLAEEEEKDDEKAEDPSKKVKKKETKKVRSAMLQNKIDAAKQFKSISCSVIVPTSALKIDEDDQFNMYRLVCLKKAVEPLKLIFKEQRLVVRTLQDGWDRPQDNDDQKKEMEKLKRDLKRHTNRLMAVCKAFYSSSFENWCHVKTIRIFVEAVLRYGLPVAYTFALVKIPRATNLKGIHDRLSQKFANLTNAAMQETKKKKKQGQKETDFTGMSESFKPYIFTQLDLP